MHAQETLETMYHMATKFFSATCTGPHLQSPLSKRLKQENHKLKGNLGNMARTTSDRHNVTQELTVHKWQSSFALF